jgi:hypothetical protein
MYMLGACGLVLAMGCSEDPSEPVVARTRAESIPDDAIKMTPALDAHPPVLHAAGWDPPAPLTGPVNTAGAEDSPFITPDGSTFYFFFTPDVRVPPEGQLLDGVSGIWAARRVGTAWAEPARVVLQTDDRLALDGCAFAMGDTLWFCSAREGYTGIHHFTARACGTGWCDVALAGDIDLSGYEVGELHISADGGELYFGSTRAGGVGESDLWLSRRGGEGWGPPENIAAVNTPAWEGQPFLTQDGSELWFTRFHLGAPAVFRSRREAGVWTAPEMILSSFAGEPTLDAAGSIYFVHHFYQDTTMVEADIYVATRQRRLPEEIYP